MSKFALMKLVFSILLSISLTLAQKSYIAVITNPEVGHQNNALNLIEVVNDINIRLNIANVVVIGNITANGKFDEFIWAQEILDELTAPYIIAGGEKDYLLSEGKGSEISILWGDNKGILNDNNFSPVCVNTFLPEFPSKIYIDIETLNWLEDNLSNSKTSRLLTFSYHPIRLAENGSQFFELTLDKKIFSFVGKEDRTVKDKSMLEGLYLNRKDGWGYMLVSSNKDSIHITKILNEEIKKKTKPEIFSSLFSKSLVLESKESLGFISPGSKIWSINLKKTKGTSSIYNSDKIYNVFKDGSVICFNNLGIEQWRYESNKKILSPPIVENDLLVLSSDDGDIITLNSNSGNPHQIIGIGEKITSGVSIIDMVEQRKIDKAVIVGTIYGNVYCYDLFTLDPIWSQKINFSGQGISIVTSIVHFDNKVFFADDAGILYCFSAVNGMIIWKLEASKGGWRTNVKTLVSQIGKERSIFLIDSAGNLFCIDALLGTVKWNIKNIFANGLIRLNYPQELVLPTKNNKVVIVSPKLGKVVSEIVLPSELKEEAITDLVVIEDKILIGVTNGWLYKIKIKQKAEKFFRGGLAPIVSLTDVEGNCLAADYDGRLSLLKLTP